MYLKYTVSNAHPVRPPINTSGQKNVVQGLGRIKEPAWCRGANEGQDVTNGSEEGHRSVVQDLGTMKEPVWCGGANEGQAVTIRLVPNGRNRNGSKDREETLKLLKVHSSHLRRCSKYFETCLSERWSAALSNADASSDVEFALEVHGDLACYTDCFFHMYSSFRKEFRDVKYSLELLKVASQIEYRELMDSIVRYLSAIAWSGEDEIMIREYSSSPDFPRNFAEDLVTRLGLEVVEEESQKHMCGLIQQSIHSALGFSEYESSNSRSFVESLLDGIKSEMSSSFAKTVIEILIKGAKEKFEDFDRLFKEDVTDFAEVHTRAMNWILRVLLDAGVAEELVDCFLLIESIPKFLVSEEFMDYQDNYCEGKIMASLVLRMYQEVAAGRLHLRTAERVALIKNWQALLKVYFSEADYGEATKLLFSTLPCKEQIEHVKLHKADFQRFIDASSLAKLVKKTWTAMEGKRSRPVVEGHSRQQGSSNGGEDEQSRPTVKAKRERHS